MCFKDRGEVHPLNTVQSNMSSLPTIFSVNPSLLILWHIHYIMSILCLISSSALQPSYIQLGKTCCFGKTKVSLNNAAQFIIFRSQKYNL